MLQNEPICCVYFKIYQPHPIHPAQAVFGFPTSRNTRQSAPIISIVSGVGLLVSTTNFQLHRPTHPFYQQKSRSGGWPQSLKTLRADLRTSVHRSVDMSTDLSTSVDRSVDICQQICGHHVRSNRVVSEPGFLSFPSSPVAPGDARETEIGM